MKGKEGQEKIQQIRGISSTDCTLTCFKLIICQGAEEVGEKGGGAEGFESRHNILIVVPVVTKRGGEDKVLVHLGSFFTLGRDVVMESKDRDALVMEV